ncbi:MAG: Ig-like domain-containing protein, partial [Gemmatimonadota bacterium]|nr:Ig-like domain-containing protein [Gemmatimonadota bacterium]
MRLRTGLSVAAAALVGVTAVIQACTTENITGVIVTSVTVTPPSATLPEGEAQQFTAVVKDDRGVALSGATVAWSSDAPTVVSVDGEGVAHAVLVGTTKVRASYQGTEGSADVTVIPGPSIAVSLDSVGVAGVVSGLAPDPEVIQVTNGGGGTLSGLLAGVEYPAGASTGWVTAALSSATAPAVLTLTFLAGALAEGVYDATVVLQSPVARSGSLAIAVRLTLTEQRPVIRLTPSSVTLEGVGGGSVSAPSVVQVENVGGGVLTALAASIWYEGTGRDWLQATLADTTAPAGLTLQADPGTLAPGVYTAEVRVASALALNSPQPLAVTFVVADPGPAPDLVVVESGGGTLVNEGATTDDFTVALAARPLTDVVLVVSSGDVGEATVAPAGLTFTATDWDVPQVVTVTGVDDPAVDGSQTTTVTVSVDDALSDDAYDTVPDGTVSVVTTDDDAPDVSVTPTGVSTTVTEGGGMDTVVVVLAAAPTSNVVLVVSSDDPGEVSVSPAALTFTPANWSVQRIVTVTGVDDALLDGDQASLVTVAVDAVNSDDGYDPVPDRTVPVTTSDDDVAGFTVVESGGSTVVNEGGSSDGFTVELTAEPASDVVLLLSSGDAGEATVSPASLTFVPAEWNVPRTVTVTGVDDALIDGPQVTSITVSVNAVASDAAFATVSDSSILVTTADNDAPGFTVAQTDGETSVTEGGSTDQFTIVLAAQPASDVVFHVVSADPSEAVVSPAGLTFTSANWDVFQTVTVTGVDDDIDDGSAFTTVTVSVDPASDPAYQGLADQTVTVATTDDDASGFTVAATDSSTSVSEAGTVDTVTVVLMSQPVDSVTLVVTSSDVGEATVSPDTLVFHGGDWTIPRIVVVTGEDDPVDDGTQTSSLSVAVVAAGSDATYGPLPPRVLSVTTTDNDAAGFTIAQTGGGTLVTEAGGTDAFTVVLTGQPTSDVVLTVTSTDALEVSIAPGTLTFTPGNWSVPQPVTVTGVDDSVDDGNRFTPVVVSVDDALSDDTFDPLADQTVSVTTTDDDVAGITLAETATNTVVSEARTTDVFTLVLDTEPVADVVMTVASGDTSEATVSPDTLTFTAANWNVAQAVTVTGEDDSLTDGDQVTLVTVSVGTLTGDSIYAAMGPFTVNVTTTDDESAGFVVTETSGSTEVSEALTSDSLGVRLTAQPGSNVVLTVTSGNPAEATVSPSSLTFTTGNWSVVQTVTVTGVDDVVVDGNQNTVMTIAVDTANSDAAYGSLAARTVSATTLDDDVAGFTIAESGGGTAVPEAGGSDGFTVVLDRAPTSNVVFSVVSSDTGEATVTPGTLTFGVGNWNVPQAVTVTGVDDFLLDGPQITAVVLSVNAGSAAAFSALAPDTVSVTTTDDDVAGFVLADTAASTVDEAGLAPDSFTVVLTARPTSNVVFTVSSGDTGEVTVAPATLTFTNADWNQPQRVRLTGANDSATDGDQTTTITVAVDTAASDDGFDGLQGQTALVTTTDDEVAGFILADTAALTVSEAATTDVFTVALTAEPTSDVVLTVASADTGEATVAPDTLTFTPLNWDSAQTVTVTGVDDLLDDSDQTTTITVSVVDARSDDAFDGLPGQTASVVTLDNEAAGFVVSQSAGGTLVSESMTTDSFTVVLTAQPTSDVVFTVTSGNTAEATVAPDTLTFTNVDWNVAQVVTVTGVDDALLDGNVFTLITVSVIDALSDNAYDPVADQNVSVLTTDNDTPGFVLADTAALTVDEAGAAPDSFTVVLTAQPDSSVVFTVSSGDTGEATVAPATLTFTNANWNVAQRVRLAGVDDGLTDGGQITTITVAVNAAASDDAFDALPDQTASVTTTDDEVAGFALADTAASDDAFDGLPGQTALVTTTDDEVAGFALADTAALTVDEAGAVPDSFTVVLTAQPVTDVVFAVTSGDTGEATVAPATLTFTTLNWNVAQRVRLAGVDDGLTDGGQTTTITVAVDTAASDDAFDGLPGQTALVTTTDDEVAGFALADTAALTVDETGAVPDSFTVVLTAQPTSDVVLTVASGDTGEATVAPAALTFTTSNWNVAQWVRLAGVDDGLTDGGQTTTITVAVDTAASDDAFDGLPGQTASVTTTDDEVAGFALADTAALTVDETGAVPDSFTVVLTAQPTSDVVL